MKYKSKATHFNGVANYVSNFKIETERKCSISVNDVDNVIKEFISEKGQETPKTLDKRANFVQNNFTEFTQYLNKKYEKKRRCK